MYEDCQEHLGLGFDVAAQKNPFMGRVPSTEIY